MRERLDDIIGRLPRRVTGLAVAFGALAGAATAGFATRGALTEQLDLPAEVRRFELRVDSALDSLGARIDTTGAQIRELVDSQERVTRRLDRLICLLSAEQTGEPAFGCERAPDD